ncbi:MAG TPA: crosslink repair DNA glycosylase YcaQ family protein, partial [Streptosporangiaceae bacterium]|nr:crosslink repair DNA glycosylase YcaQ family protein [Streptosporangiaceae bacterium]
GAGPGDGPDGQPAVPALRLLGAFDPLLLGWASRADFLAPGAPVIAVNGLFRPFVLRQGRGCALWTITRGQVVTGPLGPLTAPEQAALAAEVADVTRFLAGQPGSVRSSPSQ